jgi:large subunit ribosomal protein L13
MLPTNRRRKHIMRRLKIYTGADHPHQAQQPVPMAPVPRRRNFKVMA